jgi:hypothetical protein
MSQANNYTFPVLPDHAAYAARYCELCGGEVDQHGECNGPDQGQVDAAELVALVGTLARWALHRPTHMRVLACRVDQPGYTIREVAEVVGLGRSQVQATMREIAAAFPALKPILGFSGCRSRSQVERRKHERIST